MLEDFVILEKFERSEQAEKMRDHARANATNMFEHEQMYDDMKREVLKEAGYSDGIHLWTLGFRDEWSYLGGPTMNSDEHDDDAEDMEDGEEEASQNYELIERMRSDDIVVSETFTVDELELIKYSPQLQVNYDNHWFRCTSNDTYLMAVNYSTHNVIRAGE